MTKWFGILLAIMIMTMALSACAQQEEVGKEETNQAGAYQSTIETNDSEGLNEGGNIDLPGNGTIDDGDQNEAVTDSGYNKIMTDISVNPAEILAYIKDNGSKLSTEQAVNLVLKLEQLQMERLPEMTDRYFEEDQSDLLTDKVYNFDTGKIQMDSVKNEGLRNVLEEAQSNGYKTETAEASFFPVIDYSIYTKFSVILPEDLSDYFSLMAVESGKKPASDGGLVIGWDEVFSRAIAQEQFILKYGKSQKLNEAKELYGKYVNFIFDGSMLPNTPHFTYNTKVLNPRLKESLLKAAEGGGDSPLEKAISDYLDVLKKNNFKLTAEVKQFRDNAVATLSK